MCFPEALKLILQNRNLKQADLCRMTGIQTSLMSDYLGGKKSPTLGNAILMADALNISLDTLAGKDTHFSFEERNSSKILAEICEEAKGLSQKEQLYLLDTVKALKQRMGRGQK